jgi:CheY-like chemotaxis protein
VLADINGQTLGLLDSVRSGEGLAGAIDPNTPMIVLTSRADELDRVRVLDRGGDDVVSKPFSYPSCAPASAWCCAAPTSPAPSRSAGSAP